MKTKLLLNLIGITISLFSISMFSMPSYGQVIRCATVENDSLLRLENPDMQSDQDFEVWLAEKIEERRQLEASGLIINGVYQIPVVVHVVHNGEAVGSGTNISYAAILSQIDVLNEDFRRIVGTNGYNTHPDGADTQIEFCLARRRPDGSAFPNGEHGVNRINRNTAGFTAPPYSMNYTNATIKPYCTVTQNWSPSRYMNFWSLNLGSGLLGYAQFPTTILGGMGCGAQSASTDGVVMLYSSIGKSSVTNQPAPYNEGRTATHEIGHWLGLRHIWGDSPNCDIDDFCLDTPPSDAANYGCPTNHQSCGSLDMVRNYMDYTDDLCMNIFTNDQRMRMRTVLENSPIRASLITSDACVPPAVNDASVVNVINPKGDHCPGPITPTVVLRNRGTANLTSATIRYTIDGGTPVNFNWTGSIAPAGSANVTLPAFTAALGIHTFSATSLMPNGVADPHTTFDASEITFAISNGYQPNYTQNFDGGQFPPDVRWTVVNPNSDCYAWVGGTAVSSTGVTNNACAVMTNYGNATNQDEYLYTPYFILPCNAASAQLSFDVAYRRRATGNTDRLRVEISTDCGATWQATPVYDKSGTTLQTVTTTLNDYWIPTAAGNWRAETINLSSFVGLSSSSVQFRFRATNAGNGGNIYVDNVRMTASQPVEIQVSANGTEVLDGGFFNFGTQTTGATVTQTFTVQNTGTSALTLTPPITITGASQFTVSTSFGSTTIPAGGSTTFVVSFTPNGIGPFTAVLSFTNNDCDEGTYNFELTGSGDSPGVVTAAFSTSQSTICSGSTVTFTDNSVGATSWNWNFGAGATPATATGAGPHTVTYATAGTKTISLSVNGGGASTTGTVQVNATPAAPTVSVANNCGSSTLTATGSNLVWSTGATTASITTSSAGTYTVTQTVGGCTSASASGVANPTAIPSAPTVSVVNNCGSSTLTATGSNLLWSTGATTSSITVSSAGTYTVTRTVGGCTSASASGVANPTAVPSAPTVSVVNNCGSSTLTATGSNLLWSTGATTASITVSSAGTYTVTRTVGGCTSASASGVANPTSVPSAPTVSVSNTCGSSTLTATGSNLVWSTGATTPSITVSSAGTYTVTQTVGGCTSASASGTSTPTATPAAPTVSVSNTCGSSTLTATGSNLVWSTGATTPSITVSSAGTYTVTQTVGGCTSAIASATASPTATPAAPTVSVSNTCGSSTLTATGSNLVWSTGATTPSITVSSAGTYTVTQTVGGCTSAIASATASPTGTPAAPTVSVSNTCGSSTLTATGSNLVWSTGETTPSITVSSAGTYTVTQTVGGCTSASASATASPATAPAAPTVSVSNTCGSSTLTATGSNLAWSTGATAPSITVSSAGTYTVTQTVGGCTSTSASVSASPLDLPVVTFGSLSNFCVNHAAVSLTSGTPAGGNYSGNGVTNGVFDPAIAGVGTWNLSYSYTDGNGCTNTAQTSAVVEACLGLEDKETSIFEIYPNPTNGLFTIVSTDPISVVQVMDNTGRLVYANSVPDHSTSVIDLSGFADGIYQVLTTTDSGVRVNKIEIRK